MTVSARIHAADTVRNIAFLGNAGSGKTTLIEQLLSNTGMIQAAGTVESGTTVGDFTDQEKAVGHSLDIAVCHFEQDGKLVNIIDTPGYADFIGRSLAVLPAVETAAIVIDAAQGVEFVAEQAMAAAADRRLCRLVIINKIDAPGANPAAALEGVRAAFGGQCLPLNLPASAGQAVADCFFEPADVEPDCSSIEVAHAEITDRIIELDDELMEAYLEQGETISLEQLHDPFERALRRGHLIPVCFTSAATGAGLRQLARIFTQLMPNPFEGNPVDMVTTAGKPFRVDRDGGDGHFVGHVLKLNIDPYVGRLATVRVHQGRLRTGDQIYVGEKRKPVRIAHLYRVQGKDTGEISAASAGELCAIGKIDGIEYNDVLHSSHDEDGLRMADSHLPEPVYGLALEMPQRGQEKKLSDALHKLVAEDPSLRVDHDADANETVLRGLGDMHLRLTLERLGAEFGVEVTTRIPRVPYRETITRPADGHCRHKKQTGGAGQFGEVFLKVEPLERGSGFEFVNQVVGGSIPGQFIPAVEKGVRQVLHDGAVTGHPIEDVRVIVYDGKHHPVDSKEVAFVTAGRKAFLDAVSHASPVVLEPIAQVEITVPNAFVGDITGHLAGIRGRIAGTEATRTGKARILAQVPIAELGEFQTSLKSLTGGEGSFTLKLDHYESAPPAIQQSLEAEHRARSH